MVHIITKEELKAKLLTSPNVYIVDWRSLKIYDPWNERVDVLIALLEKDDVFCIEIEEEENESETD